MANLVNTLTLLVLLIFTQASFAQHLKQFKEENFVDIAKAINKIAIVETFMLQSIIKGNINDSNSNLSSLLKLYYEPELYDLLSYTITDGLTLKNSDAVVLERKTGIKIEDNKFSAESKKYLVGLMKLFVILYPKALDTKIYNKKGMELAESTLIKKILTAISYNLYGNLQKVSTIKELKEADNKLLELERQLILAQLNTAHCMMAISNNFEDIGITQK